MLKQSAKLVCSCLIVFFVLGCNREIGTKEEIRPQHEKENFREERTCPVIQQKPMEIDIEEIEWYTSFEEGLKSAKKEQKPLMVDFEAHWCIWCKRLEETTYKNPQVIALSKKFIPVKVNCDTDPVTAQRYGVRGLPTIGFMDADGKLIHQVVGYRGTEDFLLEMKKALR